MRVIRLVAEGTIEEQILACAERKLRLDQAVSNGDATASVEGTVPPTQSRFKRAPNSVIRDVP